MIDAHKNILIDEDIDVDTIHNHGQLKTKPDLDLSLDIDSLMNIGGKFSLETHTNKQKLNIRGLIYNQKGEVNIQGKARQTEESVEGNAKAGDDTLTLKQGDNDWTTDDEVLIPSMDNNCSHTETRKVLSYDKSTKKLKLNQSLSFNHTDEHFEAIVLLKNRNVEVTGKKGGLKAEEKQGLVEMEEDHGFILNEGTYQQGMKINIRDVSLKHLGSKKQASIQF